MDKKQRVGQYVKSSAVAGESYEAYIPQNIPPTHPPLDMSSLYFLLDQASTALGRVDGMSMLLPDPSLFLYMYIRKEAVLSSQIEGTQSSLSDLLLFESQETPGVPIDDVTEVSCYVSAMKYGLERLKTFPLSLRLIREIHGKLMEKGRGSHKLPGEFRTSQNWIGGSRPGNASFVPPPPERLMEVLGELEKFFHDDKQKLPPLIKAALAHVQFETIHPFLDGNGRLGRLLITFILCVEGVLKEPLLYLSLYFKTNRQAYYDHLQSVRETGDWESWIGFFLNGVIDTANQANETAQAILHLFNKDREKIEDLGRAAASALIAYHYFQKHSVTDIGKIAKHCKTTIPTAAKSVNHMVDLGIVEEITGKERRRIYAYKKYLD